MDSNILTKLGEFYIDHGNIFKIYGVLLTLLLLMLAGFIIFLIILLIKWIIATISDNILRYEICPSTAKVCKKEHKDEHTTTIIKIGFIKIPKTYHYDAEYKVYLMYEGEEHCFNNKNLYESSNIGDVVEILIHKGYNAQNKLEDVYLSLK